MKKIHHLSLGLLAAMAVGSTLTSTFTSCVSDDEVGQHTAYFYPVRPNGMEFYADQVSDTTVVVSTDDWTAAVRNLIGDEGWLKITPEKASVAAGGMLYQTMKFQFSANKTGKARQAQVEVDVKTDKIDGISLPVTQYGWLNITVPEPRFTTQELATAEVVFKASVKAEGGKAYLSCRVYADATLQSDAEWLTIPDDAKTLKEGAHGLQFDVAANNGGAERTANVTLTSNGCSNTITYIQAAQ